MYQLLVNCHNKRNTFTPEEDEKLKKLYVECNGDYTLIASKMGNKTKKQCRRRYEMYIDPNFNTGEWTPEEDKLLLELVEKYGRKWLSFLSYFNRRPYWAIQSRWETLDRRRQKGEEQPRKLKTKTGSQTVKTKKAPEEGKDIDDNLFEDFVEMNDNENAQDEFRDFVI